MTTGTDAAFAARFAPLTAAAFVANTSTLANYVPAQNPFNAGMMADIGRATILNADIFNNNFYSRFLRAPLTRGQAVMKGFFTEVNSHAYDPLAADTALFNQSRPSMYAEVNVKNYSRQIGLEVNDRLIKQFSQTPEMIGEAQSAIISSIAACAADDLWTACKTYFSGSVRSAPAASLYTMTNGITDAGAGAELIEKIWDYAVNKFRFKSNKFNAVQRATFSNNVHVAIKKSWQWPAFKKLLSETFNEGFIDPNKFGLTIDWVDDFATPAGQPSGAGDLCAVILDDRVADITPMPDGYVMESFRNPARHSTAFFHTTEAAFSFFGGANVAYIFEKSP